MPYIHITLICFVIGLLEGCTVYPNFAPEPWRYAEETLEGVRYQVEVCTLPKPDIRYSVLDALCIQSRSICGDSEKRAAASRDMKLPARVYLLVGSAEVRWGNKQSYLREKAGVFVKRDRQSEEHPLPISDLQEKLEIAAPERECSSNEVYFVPESLIPGVHKERDKKHGNEFPTGEITLYFDLAYGNEIKHGEYQFVFSKHPEIKLGFPIH